MISRFTSIGVSIALLAALSNVSSAAPQNPKHGIVFNKPRNVTKQNEVQGFGEYKAVVKALQPYIRGARTGDGDNMRKAFFDHAHIVGSINGKFFNSDVDTFKKGINKGGESPNVKHHIAWIDISGPAAAAKVEFIDWRGLRFTDFFVLYKHEGKWKISGKVYDSHSNN